MTNEPHDLWDEFHATPAWERLDAWSNANPAQRIGALHREIVRGELVQALRADFAAGVITGDEYVEGCVEAARSVFGDEDGDDVK